MRSTVHSNYTVKNGYKCGLCAGEILKGKITNPSRDLMIVLNWLKTEVT